MLRRDARSAIGALVAIAVTSLLGGCVSQEGTHEGSQSLTASQIQQLADKETASGHDEQADLLEDGRLTQEEYAVAFDLLTQCLSSQGVRTTIPVVDPVSNDRFAFSYDFAGVKPDVAVKAIDLCEARYWKSVSIAYSAGVSPHMDPALVEATSKCLQEKGLVTTTSPRSVREFVDALGKESVDDITSCIQDAVVKLYPDLSSFTVGY